MSLIALIESRRIALIPEHGAGWCAQVYDDEAEPQYTGYGLTVDEAITAALSPDVQAAERCHSIPDTSFHAFNAKADSGEL